MTAAVWHMDLQQRRPIKVARRNEDIANGVLLKCRNCRQDKPVIEFRANSDAVRGTIFECKPCGKQRVKDWVAANPDKHKETKRKRHLANKYKTTPDQVDNLLKLQDNKCAICRKSLKKSVLTCVDHDHKTGLIRGMLCRQCNTGIGNLRDDPRIVESALSYLERHSGDPSWSRR